MKRVLPARRFRRLFHRRCGVRIRGDLFLGDQLLLQAGLVVDGTVYLLTPEETKRGKSVLRAPTEAWEPTGFDRHTLTIQTGTLNLGGQVYGFGRWYRLKAAIRRWRRGVS